MELHQLEYFLAVEKARSFSAAAQEICVSQSTLSQQIRKLEETLGVRLLIRGSRGVRLTPAGEEFALYARRITCEIHRAREAMQQYTSFVKGNLRIGMVSICGHLGMHKPITAFMKAYPGITLEVREANTDELVDMLLDRRIHVAFMTSPFISNGSIEFHPLLEDDILVLLPSSHPLAVCEEIDLCDLAHDRFLMIRSSTGLRNALVQACVSCGFEPNIVLETSHAETLQSFVEEGLGVAFIGRRVASRVAAGRTRAVQVRPRLRRQSGLGLLNPSASAARLFRDFILQHQHTFFSDAPAEDVCRPPEGSGAAANAPRNSGHSRVSIVQ
ncbi:MAG: LysR family transcriptional regulator [Alicyclobacillaceae bacterium]|nr:LysR family transcriptional regulator [Alicyclobacillaceae bacterium]